MRIVLAVLMIAASCISHEVTTTHEGGQPEHGHPTTQPSPAVGANQPASPVPAAATPMTVSAFNAALGESLEHGTISAISSVQAGWYVLDLAPKHAGIALQLSVGTTAQLPFHVGDAIVVRSNRVELGATSFDIAVGVLDEHGSLLAGSFTDRAALEDWAVTRVGVEPCTVEVSHGAASTVIPPGAWYTLRATDGAFAVSVTCARPAYVTPPGAAPPNDYFPDSNVVQVSRLPS
jgi:hypothetical protein